MNFINGQLYTMTNIVRLTFILIITFSLVGCSEPDRPSVELYVAVKRGDIDQVERHIYWKTNINELNVDGQSPLHVSASNGRMIIARLLLKNGADVNSKNIDGKTAVDLALRNGRTEMADMLINKFAAEFDATKSLFDITLQNIQDRDVIRFLSRKGAQFNHHNEAGLTPLIIAIKNNQRLLAKHLIANNADVNTADKQNRLPLDIAIDMNNKDIIALLHAHGARQTTRN